MMSNRYQNNLTVLESINPQVSAWIESAPVDPKLIKLPVESNQFNLRITPPDGPSFELYDSTPLETQRKKTDKIFARENQASVVFGLGLGYRVLTMAEAMFPGHVLFVVEENPAMIRLALETVDLVPYFASNQLIIVAPDNQILLELARKLARRYRRKEVGIYTDETCMPGFSADFQEKIEHFKLDIKNEALAELFLIKDAALTVENEIRNLPSILSAHPVEPFHYCFQGIPAVIVSAGPSLGSCVHQLRNLAGKAVIIATAPVLRVLKAHDVTPDFVVIIDFGVSNYDVFQDVYGTEDVPLIFLQPTYHRIVRDYQGPLISVMSSDSPVRRWLAPHFPWADDWPVGRNVGGFCLDLAIYFGANPIILVGQDLSFPDSASHTEGVIGRRLITSQRGEVWLEGVGGRRVKSDLTHASYLKEFEAAISRCDQVVINTSPTGARIRGSVEMSFQAAAEQYGLSDRPIKRTIEDRLMNPIMDLQAVQADMRSLLAELDVFVQVARHASLLGRQIHGKLTSGDTCFREEIKANLDTYWQFYSRIETYWQVFELLNKYLSAPIAMLDEAWHRIEQELAGPEKLATQLNAHIEMLTTAADETTRLIGIIQEAAKEVELLEFVLEADRNPLIEADVHLEAARAWVRLGRYCQAWEHFRSVVTQFPDSTPIIGEAADLLIRRERPAQARRLCDADSSSADNLISEWSNRAAAAIEHDDWITAMVLSRKVLAAEPDHKAARKIEQECILRRNERSLQNPGNRLEKAS